MRNLGVSLRGHFLLACIFLSVSNLFSQVGPTIISPPKGQTVNPGATVTFQVTAIASSPFYQWYHNSSALNNHFSNSLTLTNVQLRDAGSYVVEVSDLSNSIVKADSDPAQLVVLQAPQITSQPASQTNIANANVTFSVAATGGPVPAYQWKLNDVVIDGATQSALNLSNIQSGNAGSYTVVVSNCVQAITSAPATLTITDAPPTMVTNLANRVAIEGTKVTLSTVTYGTAPLFYRWNRNGSDIPGSTNSTLDFVPVRSTNQGKYSVTVSNSLGSVTSRVATLTIESYPNAGGTMIAWGDSSYGRTLPPVGATNVVALAAGSYETILLRQDGTLADVGSPLRTPLGYSFLPPVAAINIEGSYAIAVAQDGTAIEFGINANAPSSATNIVAVAVGTPRLAVRDDGKVIGWLPTTYPGPPDPSGIFSSASNLSQVVSIAVGDFHALALRSDHTIVAFGFNGNGETSVPAGLNNVIAIAAGISHCLVLRSNGTVVAWGDNSLGQTNVPLGLSNVVAIAAGFYHNLALRSDGTVVAWGDNSSGQCNVPSAVSNVLFISAGAGYSTAIVKQPAEAVPPTTQWVFAGKDVTFTFSATGYQPLFYQWQFSGTNIAGATNSSLVLSNVGVANAGQYQCVISNAFGTAVGSPASLFVYRQTPVFDPAWTQQHFTNEGFGFLLKYLSGHGPTVVQTSTNLLDWQPIYTNQPMVGSFQYFDQGVTNSSSQFYRAIEE